MRFDDDLLLKICNNHPLITHLWFIEQQKYLFGNLGAIKLADALRTNVYVKYLQLDGCNIRLTGAEAIADSIKYSTTLTYVGLSHNNIGIDGAKAIAVILSVNKSITAIDLSGCNIQSGGGKVIALALKHRRKACALRKIDLSDNYIDDEDIASFADMLLDNESLIILNLARNNPTLLSVHAMTSALRHNKTLKRLYLDIESLMIGKQGYDTILEMLQYWNDTLETFHIQSSHRYSIYEETKSKIYNLLEENHEGNRIAPNKAERQLRTIFNYLWYTWTPGSIQSKIIISAEIDGLHETNE